MNINADKEEKVKIVKREGGKGQVNTGDKACWIINHPLPIVLVNRVLFPHKISMRAPNMLPDKTLW